MPEVKIVRWRSGKLHVSPDGLRTACGADVVAARAPVVQVTEDWHLFTNCYNCAYRLKVPPGHVQPRDGKDFPIRRACQHDRDPDTCYSCNPSKFVRNWPCPNGCTDQSNHVYSYPRCLVWPPKRSCDDCCESLERALTRANPKSLLDLPDSAMSNCYHCDGYVCASCQSTPVEGPVLVCDCEAWADEFMED
jgi:hypothetical protein